jgi:predicted  nucleic acid-binding Zn-ribbon protein
MTQGNDENPKTDRDTTIARLRMLSKSRASDAPGKELPAGVEPPSTSRSNIPKRSTEPLTLTPSALKSGIGSKSPTAGESEWSDIAHRTFVATINAKISELLAACRNLERERADIEVMRSDLQQAVDAAELRIAEAESIQVNERILELENRLLESNEENIRLAEELLTARSEFDALVDYVEEQEQRAEEEAKNRPDPNLPTARELELQQELEQFRQTLQQSQSLIDQTQRELEQSQRDLRQTRHELEQLRLELERSKKELEKSRQEIDALEKERDQASTQSDQARRKAEQVRHDLEQSRLEIEQLKGQVDFLGNELKTVRETPSHSEQELEGLRQQIDELREELKQARSVGPQDDTEVEELRNETEDLRNEVDQLHVQLTRARAEAVEFRMQADELSAKIARMKGPDQRERSQAMSWEERKQALLEQLEAESEEASETRAEELLAMEKVIQETSEELEKKDAEIQELRNLLEQQSISQDGLAIGAAALAQTIDNDALIIAERMKLKELQADWEQKQRQFEIDMSLERAKIARERLELQEKLRDLENLQTDATNEKDPGGAAARAAGRKGKWLSRLGLKEE